MIILYDRLIVSACFVIAVSLSAGCHSDKEQAQADKAAFYGSPPPASASAQIEQAKAAQEKAKAAATAPRGN